MFKAGKFTLCIIFLLSLHAGFAEDNENLHTHLKISEIRESVPPHFFKGDIVLTYKATGKVRFVGAAFQHENFAKIHPFFKNKHGIYILFYPLPEKKKNLFYRIIVDGLWMPDPANPLSVIDNNGIEISYVNNLPAFPASNRKTPIIHDINNVEFVISAPSGKQISIMGNFNNWDPFSHTLKEIAPGKYSITLRLDPGEYYYYFYMDGQRITDPCNSKYAYNNGKKVSRIDIGNFHASARQ